MSEADDLFPPDVMRELERQRHEEAMERIRKKEAIRRALATEEFILPSWRAATMEETP